MSSLQKYLTLMGGYLVAIAIVIFNLGYSFRFFVDFGFLGCLLIGAAYFAFNSEELRKEIDRLKGQRRPKRSRDNELGSSDLATRDHILFWLKRSGPLDTVLPVTNLRGGDGVALRSGTLVLPCEERNRHMLIIAKTGSGKTTRMILPILYSDCMSSVRSTVVVDSKPEMWEKLAGMTAKYNPEKKIMLFNPLDTVRSLSWNVLSKIENDTDAKLIANTIIQATEGPNTKADSPFFKNNALQLLNAIFVGLLEDANERLSMPRTHQIVHSGKENLCQWLEAHPGAIRSTRTFVELVRSGSQNADTVLSELGMRLSAWDIYAIRSTTFAEELDLETLVSEPSLLIIEFRESEIEMLRPMANVIVVELLRFLTKRAESCPNSRLPRPVSLVVDEFASAIGRLPDIHVKLNTLRSRNVSIVAAIQSIGQIKANYEKDADSVLSGFSTKIIMPAVDFQDAEWASKETGTMTIRFKTSNAGSNKRLPDAFAHHNRGMQEQVQQRAVLTPDEIGRPADNIATFFLPNTPVFQGFLTPYYKDPEMVSRIGSGDHNFSSRTEPLDYRDPVSVNGKPMTERQLREELEGLKTKLGWETTTGVSRDWWLAFEEQNQNHLPTVYTLCQELDRRSCTISDFFQAYVDSNATSIPGILEYMDKLKENPQEAPATSAGSGDQRVVDESQPIQDVGQHVAQDIAPGASGNHAGGNNGGNGHGGNGYHGDEHGRQPVGHPGNQVGGNSQSRQWSSPYEGYSLYQAVGSKRQEAPVQAVPYSQYAAQPFYSSAQLYQDQASGASIYSDGYQKETYRQAGYEERSDEEEDDNYEMSTESQYDESSELYSEADDEPIDRHSNDSGHSSGHDSGRSSADPAEVAERVDAYCDMIDDYIAQGNIRDYHSLLELAEDDPLMSDDAIAFLRQFEQKFL